jgi:hypothetical protein
VSAASPGFWIVVKTARYQGLVGQRPELEVRVACRERDRSHQLPGFVLDLELQLLGAEVDEAGQVDVLRDLGAGRALGR